MTVIIVLIAVFFLFRAVACLWWNESLGNEAHKDNREGGDINWYLDWDVGTTIFHPKYYHLWTPRAWIKHLKGEHA